MAKKLKGKLKIQVPAANASPSTPIAHPIGPTLGQRQLNIMEFCNAFNKQTQKMEANTPCNTIITYYSDNSFSFIVKSPPVSYLLKKSAGLSKASQVPGREPIGSVSNEQVRNIAKIKINDMNAFEIGAAMREIEGTARSMGIVVKD